MITIENPSTSNILEVFFREIKIKGKYEIEVRNNSAYIIPREEEQYYKPIIRIPDLNYFSSLLIEYINSINDFNTKNNIELKEYQDLSYILNIMLFNIAPSDADDLNKFMETRISFLKDDTLEEFTNPNKILEYESITVYAQKKTEDFGLETPYIMTFSMDVDGKSYNLPIIRYGINSDGVCFIYAVQIGRGRTCDTNNMKYKYVVNQINQGVKVHRNISPSFVLILSAFIKILNSNGINKIMIPDFLFNRYKKYYRANTTAKSNEILSRMFHNITTLIQRMDNQMDGFNIQSYPLNIDSYYHIEITNLKSENKMLKKMLKSGKNTSL